MTDPEYTRQILKDMILPTMLGGSAAIAYVSRHGWPGITKFLRLIILGSFYGVIMYWLLDLVDVPLSVKFGMTGGGVVCLLELGDALFDRARTLINKFELPSIFGWLKGKDEGKGE